MKNLVEHLKSIFGFINKGVSEQVPFRTIFTRFKQVLDDHNRAIEVIADMGDKLGGDYLFDINYIKKAYSELFGAVYSSMQDFDVLTKNKYLKLHDVFDRIDTQIKSMIFDASPTSGERVLFYEDITWDRYSEVGGKNANLAELKNYLKLNVPDGFAVTTHAFDEFIRHNGLEGRIKSLGPPMEGMLNELRDLIINGEIHPELSAAIDDAIERLKEKSRGGLACAVRSSATEEDSEHSFAGQFETLLNVPLKGSAVKDAYKRVIASLFSDRAIAYQRQIGYEPDRLKMAVGCIAMVDAEVSGVIYSEYPLRDGLLGVIVTSSWGLGKSIVDGDAEPDQYILTREAEPRVIERHLGKKEFFWINKEGGGIERLETPREKMGIPSIGEELAKDIAREAWLIERHFGSPQDIEWAIDKEGKIFILQSRPIQSLSHSSEQGSSLGKDASGYGILIKDKGIIVQKGTGAGRVFVLKHMDELDSFPKGSVLVARHDSSDFIRVMPYASAIITDVGTPTSHMASLCREFRVPTIVNAGNATQIFKHGQEITVNADDDSNVTIYDGIIAELVEHANTNSMTMDKVYEFRKKRYILRHILPLNLIDPLLDNFTPEGCKTMHDILRFIHERSVMELVEAARSGLKRQASVKLDLPIPTGIMVVDIGGGLNITEDKVGDKDRVTFEQVASIPLRAVLKGMLYPGVWHSDIVSLKAKDFLTSMIRMSDITFDGISYIGNNMAVASREYMNLSLRFGYHFNVIDCYCSENARNNHIYFRFVGGATDITKRSRRVRLIAEILKEYGFNIKTRGDIMVARLANIRQDEMENILDKLGRLIAYTRQLDAVLHDDGAVERYSRNFLKENYGL